MPHFPDATGYERGLYTFPELPSEGADFIEQRFLLRADDASHEVLQRMLGGQLEFDVDLRSKWSRFLMTLIHRSPEGIARIKKHIIDDMPAALDRFRLTYEALPKKDGDPTFEEFCASLSEVDTAGTQSLIIQRLMNSERLGAELNGMEWRIITINQSRHPLLTSDRPLIMPEGIGKPGGYLFLPISPDRVFFAFQSKITLDEVERSAERTRFSEVINNLVVRQAHIFAWGTDENQLRFVQNRLGEKRPWSPWTGP